MHFSPSVRLTERDPAAAFSLGRDCTCVGKRLHRGVRNKILSHWKLLSSTIRREEEEEDGIHATAVVVLLACCCCCRCCCCCWLLFLLLLLPLLLTHDGVHGTHVCHASPQSRAEGPRNKTFPSLFFLAQGRSLCPYFLAVGRAIAKRPSSLFGQSCARAFPRPSFMPPAIVSEPLETVSLIPARPAEDPSSIAATWEEWCVANGITDARDQHIGSVLVPRLFPRDYDVARQAMAHRSVAFRRDPLCVTVWANSAFYGCPELIKHLIDITKRHQDTNWLDERAYRDYIELSARLRRDICGSYRRGSRETPPIPPTAESLPEAQWLDWLCVRIEIWGSLMGDDEVFLGANNRSSWALDSILWIPAPDWENIPCRWWQRLLRPGGNVYERTQVLCEYYEFSKRTQEWVPFAMLA